MSHWQVQLGSHPTLQLNNLLFFFSPVLLTHNAVTEDVKGTYPFPVGTDF